MIVVALIGTANKRNYTIQIQCEKAKKGKDESVSSQVYLCVNL